MRTEITGATGFDSVTEGLKEQVGESLQSPVKLSDKKIKVEDNFALAA